ncbi:MAG: serine/threonine-protein kinase [Acidobacteriota bacterium]
MTPERWARVGSVFDAALQRPDAEREAFVRASGEPDDIVHEVLALLRSHASADGFLETPPVAVENAAPLAPGAAFGPYRIVRLLGQGGMGVVYEAEDTRLGRRVALKAVAPRLARDERLRARLRKEARAAAALSHPGIATVYALEEFDGHVAIASELIEGPTLREEIDRGPLPMASAVETALAIARALAAAHARGLVHRDLKPENVMRARNGAIKVLDFGLVQFGDNARDLATHTQLTETGTVAGTPPYMAPEQLLSRGADFRADHFAFGVLLYELVCGAHPFGAGSLASVIARVLGDAPTPPRGVPAVPPALWAVIDRCLRKDPAKRYASTEALVEALEAARDSVEDTPHLTPLPYRGPRPTTARYVLEPAPAPAPADRSLQWWRFHQISVAIGYWAMLWPAWHVHRWIVPGGLVFFLALVAAVVVAGNLRLHLWFTSRVYPTELDAQRAWVARWLRIADVAFALLLAGGGLAIADAHTEWGAFLVATGLAAGVLFLVIEPTTARAALGGPGAQA